MTTLTTTCQIREQLIFFFQDVSIIRQIRIFRLIMFLLRILKKYKNYLNTKVVKKTLIVKYPCDNFSQNPLNPINVTSGHLRYARMKPFILSPSSWNQAVETRLKQVQTLNAIRKYLCLAFNSDFIQSADLRQAMSDNVHRRPVTSGDIQQHLAMSLKHPATSGK